MNRHLIALRLPDELLTRVDAYAKTLADRMPGMQVNRSDAIRVLLTRSLDKEDQDGPKKQKT